MRAIDFLSVAPGAPWIPLADAVAKATLLFAAAGMASFVLRRGSAASRHLVWTLALVSALALPVFSVALPHWQLPLVTLSSPSSATVASMGIESEMTPQPPVRLTSATPSEDSSAAGPAVSSAPPMRSVDSGISRRPLTGLMIMFLIWGTGAALILLRLAAGLVAVQWMSRRTERVTGAPWLPLARTLVGELGISPRIVFLRSRRAAMPMAWGILRPAVLMPADADTWPAERLRIVLLHELAHVKRRDCLTHMLAQISCALHWFNPLVWVAARHARTERERACDDLVLAAGTDGPDYADQLLEIARVMRSGRFPALFAGASLAMAHRSQLEGRLMAILDPTVPRAGVSRLRTMAATSLFACAVMPLASVQPWGVAAADEQHGTRNAAAADHSSVQAGDGLNAAHNTAKPERGEQSSSAVRSAATTSAATQSAAKSAAAASEAVTDAAVEAALSGIQSGLTAVQSALQGRAQSIQRGVQSEVQSSVQSAIQSALGTDLNSSITSEVNSSIHSAINSNINTHVNASVHGGMDQDAKGKAADPRMVAALTAALKDTDKDVRETALQALVRLRDPGSFDPLVQALSDTAPDVRQQAAFGLGQLRDRRAVDPLTRALKDANGDVREQAAFALGQIRDRTAVPALAAALKDPDDDVREQAVFALGQLRDPAAFEALGVAAHDAKTDVRQQAVFALGQLRDRRAVEPLVSALKDADAGVREQAAFALGQIRDAGAVEALVIALKDSIPDVRAQAAFALGQLRDPRAIEGLTAALKDANPDVRQQAAFALGQLSR
jgi:HEAT repeat protein/beta-lactamase regulating signal transducer with metallopeptidase domain